MAGRNKWHRHPKAVVEAQPALAEAEPLPPPPGPLEGPALQFHESANSMYVPVGL